MIQLADGRVFVGVYDGHAGPCAAEHAAATLHTRLDVAPRAGGSSNAAMWEAAYEQCEREILRRFRDGTTACTAVLRVLFVLRGGRAAYWGVLIRSTGVQTTRHL